GAAGGPAPAPRPLSMLRWLIGGGREPQGLAEKSSVQTIGEEQIQNPYTELLVLKGHQDIVRFLVQIDDCRFASAGDDGIIFLWNAEVWDCTSGRQVQKVSCFHSTVKASVLWLNCPKIVLQQQLAKS
ncbi:hypothetical protein EK904_007232, partial [Melospiza melodia maxima]